MMMTTARLSTLRPLPCALVTALALLGTACGGPKVMSTGTNTDRGNSGGSSGGNGSGGSAGSAGVPGIDIDLDAGTGVAADSGPTAPAASCAEEAHDGKMVPVDLLFLVDVSGSMEEAAGAQSKWVAVRTAITSFVNDAKSAGIGVGLTFFPVPAKTCNADGDCGSGGTFTTCDGNGYCGMPPADLTTTEDYCTTGSGFGCGFSGNTTCTAFGLCAKSGLRCPVVGQPCTGGVAGEMCMPHPKLCSYDTAAACGVAGYQTPVVPIADLPGAAMAISGAFGPVLPGGGTPTTPAVSGALAHLTDRATKMPGRKQVLVLATDGLPNGCNTRDNDVGPAANVLMTSAMGTPAIPTYVIGVFSDAQVNDSQPALMRLATAGGTGMPFILTAGNDLTQKFQAALNQIRGSALACEFDIPMPTKGTIDYGKVNVHYTGAQGGQDLVYVGSVAKCDPAKGGWYYDVDPSVGKPNRVLLCPATCDQVKANMAAGQVQLKFGCTTKID